MDVREVRGLCGASREVVREFGALEEGWLPAGIPHTQMQILIELSERGTLCASDLVARLRSDKSLVSKHLKQMLGSGWIEGGQGYGDQRRRPWQLTASGRLVVEQIYARADAQTTDILNFLSTDERAVVERGVAIWGGALAKLRKQNHYQIREIERRDDAQVAALIRVVMPEFGASGPGFALHDPEVDAMSAVYMGVKSRYYVVEERATGKIVGGAGFGELVGGDGRTCELRKMYFLHEVRGIGMGAVLLKRVLGEAKKAKYKRCYLETLERMAQARRLYEGFGFRALCGPEGGTGHFGCDRWYAMDL